MRVSTVGIDEREKVVTHLRCATQWGDRVQKHGKREKQVQKHRRLKKIRLKKRNLSSPTRGVRGGTGKAVEGGGKRGCNPRRKAWGQAGPLIEKGGYFLVGSYPRSAASWKRSGRVDESKRR